MGECETRARRLWTLVRAGLALAPVRPRFTHSREGRRLGDHERVRGRAVLLDEQLSVQLKPGDDVEATFAAFVTRLKELRPIACGPLSLPSPLWTDNAFRMWCPTDSLSIRGVRQFVMIPTDGGDPGMRTRFDILVATTPRRRRRRRV